MKLESEDAKQEMFEVQLVLSYLLAYALPALMVATVAVKWVKPFAEKQLEQRNTARIIGESKDQHWLFGHVFKYPVSTYKGLLKLLEKTKDFPAIFPYWIGPFRLILIAHHPDVAKTFLLRSSSKSDGYTNFLAPFLRSGLVVAEGDVWKRHRRILTPIFHFNILKEHCEVFNRNCENVITLCEQAASTGKVANIGEFVADATYMNMMECMMSQKVKSMKGEDYNQLVTEVSALVLNRWFSPWLWNNFIYRRTKSGRRFFYIVDKVQSKVDKIVKERREILASLGSDATDTTEVDDQATGTSYIFRKMKGKNVDFLDVLLQSKDNDGVGLTDDEIIDEVTTFYSAGQETSGNGLAWTAYFLSENLECQQKCRDEINEVLGQKTEVEMSDVNKMRYVTQCIKESLRLRPVIHMVARSMDEDTTISHHYNDHQTVTLKKGQIVMVNFFLLHRHPDLWENPTMFDPDRFDPEKSTTRESFSFLPFSAGGRNCIGQHFAMLQMKVILSQLLRRFEIYRDSDTEPPKPVPGVSLHSANGVSVKIRKVV